ncbi:putative toxin-antitoxin system toxin component, PIN family [Cyanobacterium stanieri LEGE 03274]|uniref:Toxin-antitoxin system toxin component, PIN family n=1 Tax=Cyanobacterium stanieri LEGE 03274 TaxID=1828756 RepID=A0ABR9V0Y1_9CHRO|nr:putative toxin-antitoxin system toxin component, PIN family [Cyanobacterium stanieri]MBE9221543.1 putative toxin-antitoxin system toxin component, PIN family [Cyanobacterium stanieri LEGE 03274]
MNNRLRVVIDTNLVLSALVFGGKVAQLRLFWQSKKVTPLISRTTTTELIRVLAYPKFKLTKTEQEDLLSDYLPYCETVKIPLDLPSIPKCRDIFDEKFLLLAKVANADYLVTGDKDLLSIDDNFICPIINMDEFLKEINKII